MSQEKVNKYKQEKANRQTLMKQQKRRRIAATAAVFAAIAALAVWFCASLVLKQIYSEVTYYYADYTAIDDYVNNLSSS